MPPFLHFLSSSILFHHVTHGHVTRMWQACPSVFTHNAKPLNWPRIVEHSLYHYVTFNQDIQVPTGKAFSIMKARKPLMVRDEMKNRTSQKCRRRLYFEEGIASVAVDPRKICERPLLQIFTHILCVYLCVYTYIWYLLRVWYICADFPFFSFKVQISQLKEIILSFHCISSYITDSLSLLTGMVVEETIQLLLFVIPPQPPIPAWFVFSLQPPDPYIVQFIFLIPISSFTLILIFKSSKCRFSFSELWQL